MSIYEAGQSSLCPIYYIFSIYTYMAAEAASIGGTSASTLVVYIL